MERPHPSQFSQKENLQIFGVAVLGYLGTIELIYGCFMVIFAAVVASSPIDFVVSFRSGMMNSLVLMLMSIPAAVLFGWIHPNWIRGETPIGRRGSILRGLVVGTILGALLGLFFLTWWVAITVFMAASGMLSGTVGGWLVWMYYRRWERRTQLKEVEAR